jgi:Tol biopolymer transport system component
MGEVYRARDARLGRDVAIKALPGALTGEPDRVARFEREAQILASLNHPHIAALYGLEEAGGSRFLVLELVEGDTLARRLEAGPIPMMEALTIARQVADALHAAHDKGIIHRDLKPANIALTRGGDAKVLDFGLAKALDLETAGDVSSSPTITAGTRAGVVLGTAAYMSPEQARGKPLEKRTDIWSFGSVLFEMLAGRRPFSGETMSDTIAAMLERAPDWQLLPRSTPARIHWLPRRCLEKDPKRRLHDIADARIEIDDTLSENPAEAGNAPVVAGDGAGHISTRERVAWLMAALGVAAVIALLVLGRGGRERGSPETPRTYTASIVPEGVRLSAVSPPARFALSPDGRRIAMVAADASGRSMLWVRPLHSRVAQPLAGTEGATFPFWSPDSRFIGFLSENKLRTIDASGGQVQTLCDASFGSTGAWNRDDVILFTPQGSSPLYRVSASGGTPARATALDAANGENQQSYPFFLPDGRHFLYFVVGSKSGGVAYARGIYLGALGSDAPGRLLVEGGSNAKYADGHLVFIRDGALLAQPFDPNRFELADRTKPLAERVQTSTTGATEATGAFTVSETGLLAYQTSSLVRSQLAWFDRAGNQIAQLGEQAEYSDVALSPDDSRVVVSMVDPAVGTRDLWVFDAVRGTRDRFTFDPGDDFGPNWLRPAGDRIVFSSRRQGSVHL